MTKPKLHIASNLFLPHETQTSTLLVLGGKGMGKTNLGRVIDEELSRAGLRWSTLDPLGVWWGLRYSKDGKGRGIECLILGGVHGDMPIEPTGGAVVADLVVDESISVIIDFSRKPSGEMWGIGEKTRFLTAYARRLYQRQGELINGHRRDPIFQMLDEAARYIPQMIPHGNPELAACLSAWETLVEEGRNIGIGVGLLTQRSARINKSVSELADALFAFRTVGPNSVDAVTDWLGAHVRKDKIKEHVETLRSLERGRCLVVSPGWLQFEGIADIREGTTFDSSATPKPGERAHKVHGTGAKPDLAKYQERMRETIERAKENDPKALRQQIQQMKAELAKAPKIADVKSVAVKADPLQARVIRDQDVAIRELRASMEQIMKVVAKVTAFGFEQTKINPKQLEQAVQKAVEEIGRSIAAASENRRREFEQLKREAAALLQRMEKVIEKKVNISVDVVRAQPPFVLPPSAAKISPPSHPVTHMSEPAPPPRRRREPREPLPEGEVRLGNLHIQIAGILAGYYPEPVKSSILAAMCGKSLGGSWSARLSEVRAAGLIEDAKAGYVRATEKSAREYLGKFQAPSTTEEMLAVWEPKWGKVHREMMRFLVERKGEPVKKTELAEAVGMTPGGSFSARLSEVRSSGLLSEPGNGLVAANKEALFLEAA